MVSGSAFPSEGLGVGIVLGQVAVDRGLKVDDSDGRASCRRLVSVAKKPSTTLSQEALVGVKWKVTRGCRVQPGDHLRMLVSGVVVENDVHGLRGRDGLLDGVQEADELLMAMALRPCPRSPRGAE